MKGPLTAMSSSNINKSGKPGTSSIAELKNGKVIFRQKPISFEKNSETMQAIVKFREYLEQLMEKKEPMFTTFPQEHMPLIAKLAHESDKAIGALARYISKEISPAQDDDDGSPQATMVPAPIIEAAIKSTLVRVNYGLDGSPDAKLPSTACAWRWEVKDEFKDWLPKTMQEKAESRKADRIQVSREMLLRLAKEFLLATFEALSLDEQRSIIPQKPWKVSLSEGNGSTTSIVDLTQDDVKPEKPNDKGRAGGEENDKEKMGMEKKLAKEEREKKEKEAQHRSRSIMANFFSKPRNAAASTSKRIEPTPAPQTDFERTFKPFVVKKDATMARINWFRRKNGKQRKPPPTPGNFVSVYCHSYTLSLTARLDNVIQTLTSSTSSLPLRRRPSLQYKTFHPLTVRDVMHQLTEAEVAGDDVMVRSILAKLRDRKLFPAKVFIFTDDLRPGYFGTWTRSSRLIGPRTPLVRDMAILDYSNDSGEEWEDENANDADDVNDDAEEDDDSEADSDLESWLVEDEDEDQGVPPDVDDPFVLDVPMPAPPPKRKAVEEPAKKKLTKKRKVVVPLVPFCKGPCWEDTIGHCESDILKPYRIQLFNDCPFPVDPFTFVSTCGGDKSSATKAASRTEIPTASDISAIATSMPPPPLPSVPTVKRTASAAHKPKTPFPDVHLPFLLSKIDSLHAPTVTYLVEEIFKELRSQNVRKNSIEVKVREVAERCREKKYWVVKPGIMV
ncbi:hypothetical protein PLEOSDRAFT_1073788 [Pleurotus ostreatus PC15]|uniref:Chromatin assembly factor 1 subunit A dimerization domain-containing protein n=1 Tax=Pleurotus ostreatus (strain PC15) TaxID=1137138 RepID=A0A067NZS5_PLEO1|nr:hypothetical protein PLEOSDRAFT_1073788 [Pleurotus ostreatus PC15]